MASRNDDITRERIEVLQSSSDRDDLQFAGVALARSDDPHALDRLGEFLVRREFLSRLDDVDRPDDRVFHLSAVLTPLIDYPSPETARLALQLLADPEFGTDHLRKPFLLRALARVTPMSADAVEAFRRSNEQGYFANNAYLLAENGSPRALELLESMLADRTVPVERRIDCLHMAVVPHRIELPMLEMVARLLERELEPEVMAGVIESVFDYRIEWFKTHADPPPAWRSASTEALQLLLQLGGRAQQRGVSSSETMAAIESTMDVARALLARRKA